MPSTVIREGNVGPLGQFDVPVRGTFRTAAIHKIPQDAVYDSMNVFIREGKLQNRPGLTLLDDTSFTGPVLGGGMIVSPKEDRLLAFTATTLYERGPQDTFWLPTAIIGGDDSFAVNNRAAVDMCYMETSNRAVAIIASVGRVLKAWDSNNHVTSILTPLGDGASDIPYAKSVCISSRRVITLTDPHTLRWSKIYEYQNFPADSIAKVSQTNDRSICVRSLSTLAFVVYKERSIYVARAHAGQDDTEAFTIAEPLRVEGPAGIHAVVDIGGTHVYMTKNGRIAMYDGSSYPKWIADGLWLFLQEDIDPLFTSQMFGVFDYRLHTVTFRYPRKGDNGNLSGMVVINLPLAADDSSNVQFPSSFLGFSAIPCTYACEMRFNGQIDRSLTFGLLEGSYKSFISQNNWPYDHNINFPCHIQTGLVSIPKAEHGYVQVESFFERGKGLGEVNVHPVVSNGLETQAGIIPDLSHRIDNLEFDPVRQYIGFDVKGRFFGLKYTWNSQSVVRYSGAVLYGRSTG